MGAGDLLHFPHNVANGASYRAFRSEAFRNYLALRGADMPIARLAIQHVNTFVVVERKRLGELLLGHFGRLFRLRTIALASRTCLYIGAAVKRKNHPVVKKARILPRGAVTL